MHTRDLHAREMAERILPWLETSSHFRAELHMETDLQERLLPGFRAPDGMRISDCLAPGAYQKYREILLKAFDVDINSFDALIPFAVISAITDRASTPVHNRSQDKFLWDQAVSLGLECDGLESVEEQVAVLGSYALQDQLKDLVRIARHVSKFRQKLRRLAICYRSGQLHRLTMLARHGLGNFRYPLVDHRNAVMAARIASTAGVQATFFAVGAGHLSGFGGIIPRLKQAGYSVTPVTF